MSVPPDPTPAGAPALGAVPPPSANSPGPPGGASLLDENPELVAAGGFVGGLALAMILKRLGS